MPQLLINEENCTGCRMCQMACSYHFDKVFSRKKSAIEVKCNERKGTFKILIHKKRSGAGHGCDLCTNETTPLCAKYCAVEAIGCK